MRFLPLDYVLAGATAALALMGAFKGLSGAFAFAAATASATVFSMWAWPETAEILSSPWARGIAAAVASLLVFGLVRVCVKKFVKVLLDQPADSIAGTVLGLALAALLAFAASRYEPVRSRSAVASEIAEHVGR